MGERAHAHRFVFVGALGAGETDAQTGHLRAQIRHLGGKALAALRHLRDGGVGAFGVAARDTERNGQCLAFDRERIAWRKNRKLGSRYVVHGTPYTPAGAGVESCTFYRAVGCEACLNTGYTGRRGIYELMMVDDAVGALIL